jgi:hypothetical protein
MNEKQAERLIAAVNGCKDALTGLYIAIWCGIMFIG